MEISNVLQKLRQSAAGQLHEMWECCGKERRGVLRFLRKQEIENDKGGVSNVLSKMRK